MISMCLTATSLDWSIDFVVNHADGDLFPKILEVEAIQAYKHDFITLIEGKDLATFPRAHTAGLSFQKTRSRIGRPRSFLDKTPFCSLPWFTNSGKVLRSGVCPPTPCLVIVSLRRPIKACMERTLPGMPSGQKRITQVSNVPQSSIVTLQIFTIKSTTTQSKIN